MSALLSPDRPESPVFSDGIGDRVLSADPSTGEHIQLLRINPSLTAVPSFEFALRERVARLANFRHGYYARVRRVDRGHAHALSIVSDHVEGTRLSDLLRVAHERKLTLDTNAALSLVRQLVPAVSLLHENARDVAHGLIAPERLIVTPHARLVLVEHVLGAAIEQMQFGRERLWHEFRVAMPPSAGIPRFDQRADVTGIGVVALSLVLGRPLTSDEYPRALNDLLNAARERTAIGEEQPLSPPLKSWLARALQLDSRRAFASAPEALAALEQLTGEGAAYVAAPVALETFLSRYVEAVLQPGSTPSPIAVPTPIAAAPALSDVVNLDDLLTPVNTVLTGEKWGDGTLPNSAAVASAPKKPAGSNRKWFIAAAVVAILATGGYLGFKKFRPAPPPAMATLAVQSNPPGVPIFVDGIERGMTPERVSLTPGPHILELRGRGVPRVIPVTLTAGTELSQYLEFLEGPTTGQIAIQSEPAGATVTVDGIRRGVSPLTVAELAPGEHQVIVQGQGTASTHQVIVQAGATASLVAPLNVPTPAATAGWLSVKSPVTVEIRENANLVGTSETDRLMLSVGRHDLEFVNSALSYRATRTVQITAGKVTSVPLELPRGVIHINASPWAEVWIDGQRVGETPIGNLAVSIGAHEILFRHPQLGEKRHAVSVTPGTPVRVSMDMK
jgi:hypothetical protein